MGPGSVPGLGPGQVQARSRPGQSQVQARSKPGPGLGLGGLKVGPKTLMAPPYCLELEKVW